SLTACGSAPTVIASCSSAGTWRYWPLRASTSRSPTPCARARRAPSPGSCAVTSRTLVPRSRMRFDSVVAERLVAAGVSTLHEVLGRRQLQSGLRLLVGAVRRARADRRVPGGRQPRPSPRSGRSLGWLGDLRRKHGP